ncbi:uncharacterized protein LOC101900020 isoform X1 [Musca domestica]|uniref:Uncharacterized protein LOC101900020 isoform X1 n=1 Tax=Musca domestica TaxID=7370 RepID=A0A1I8MU08_MUSDO|nr:uncharacterized protein LOC101900020 isoform X1 [Musca domestica]
MNLHNPTLMLGLASLLVLCWIDTSVAFPSLVMPRLHRSMDNELGLQNKNMGFPQTDDDVLELEQLREVHPEEPLSYSHQQNSETLMAEEPQPLIMADETLPGLEQQLEAATPQLQSTQGPQVPAESAGETPPESGNNGGEQIKSFGGHRPPTLQNNDGGKTDGNGEKPKAKCRLGMYGAARLVYGQNPVLPNTTTTTSAPAATTMKSTTTTTTTVAPPPPPAPEVPAQDDSDESDNDSDVSAEPGEPAEPAVENQDIVENVENAEQAPEPAPETSDDGETVNQPSEIEVTEAPPEVPTVPVTIATTQAPTQVYTYRPYRTTKKPRRDEEPERQVIGDLVLEDESALRKSTSRRSVTHMTPKTAESLLKHGNGQYSSFDMAQYVFWTGDEAGVAKAVEELIQQDMMSREDALKFLHEIRVGIEYLQKSYANRIFPEEIHHNTVKKSFITKPSTTTTTTTSTTTTTTTTPKPDLQYLNFEQNLEEPENLNLAKALDNIALWHKLQAMNQGNQASQDTSEDENETRRPKIADCDHKEYNLEEIIYKLARIMFTESLTHGDEAQREIKKLMDFFEREHELGVIPLDLEQKVIHVLLQALSDTLTEKPELWPAAQYPYNRLLRSYAHTNYMRPSSTNV